jgi:hypothetical protein
MTKEYTFEILLKDGHGIGVIFADKSIVAMDKDRNTLRFALPIKKFEKPFKEQKKKGWKHFEFELNKLELSALFKALNYKQQIEDTK